MQTSLSDREQQLLQHYEQQLTLDASRLRAIQEGFCQELEDGLKAELDSSLALLPMLDILPDGHEKGTFWSINLGGSMLRIALCTFGPGRHQLAEMEQSEVRMRPEQLTCHASQLFDDIAQSLLHFAKSIGRNVQSETDEAILGFCFSFPIEQTSINQGRLTHWTKGFANEGAVGQCPVTLLIEAFKRKGIIAHVAALVNDTAGLLAAARFDFAEDSNIAVIMGTGSNVCYVEQLSHIQKWLPHYRPRTSDLILNTEAANFNHPCLPRLLEDCQLDADSSCPGEAIFEKMTAGLYLGDIVRRILIRFATEANMFGLQSLASLEKPGSLQAYHVTRAYLDVSVHLSDVRALLHEALGVQHVSQQAAHVMKRISVLIMQRSAKLLAAAVAGLMKHLRRDAPGQRNSVMADGGIFTGFQPYQTIFEEGIADICGADVAAGFKCQVTQGGSTMGAAAVAAAAHSYMGAVGGTRTPPVSKSSSSYGTSPFPSRRVTQQ